MAKKKEAATIKVRQVRSPIGYNKSQREVLRSLGLRRIRHVVERQDSPAVRGMITKIAHLVEIVEEAS
jgi:large subunit ribosomal protein L30